MDKQQEIEKMAYCLCTLPEKYGLPLSCESCGNNGNCVRQKKAEELINKGYGDVRAAVKEFAINLQNAIVINELIQNKDDRKVVIAEIEELVKEVCGDEV